VFYVLETWVLALIIGFGPEIEREREIPILVRIFALVIFLKPSTFLPPAYICQSHAFMAVE